MTNKATFPALVETYFTDRLTRQRQASPNTIASHRDTFRLLLGFAHRHLKKAPTQLATEDLTPSFIGSFLDHLEKDRANTARTRNVRLAAIHSFFKFVALEEPRCVALAQRILAIPSKRFKRKAIDFLTQKEIEALVAAPNQDGWAGCRDHALLLLAVQTGLRVSELLGLRLSDVVLDTDAHVWCTGKGRKERGTPLRRDTVRALRAWLRRRKGEPSDVLFPNARGGPLSRDGVQYLLAKHVATAAQKCPTLKAKRISPHVLRHSTAMTLLRRGVDRTVIALWLGHERVETTQVYLHADMQLKEQALNRTTSVKGHLKRYRPDDELLAFLEGL
jgi:site-specific recombinase XerD